jgi:transposase-like protein
MALDDSVLSELLEMFRAGDGLDLIRESVRLVVQELIETEAAEVIGARRYERTEARQTERNGHRSRLLSTQAGDVELRIPKLRAGSFFPSLLEPRRRIDQALYAVIAQAYVEGISTRSVDDLVQARTAWTAVRLRPAPAYQSAVPAEDGLGRDQERAPPLTGDEAGEQGDEGPVRPA